jgi:hypothetical protein
MTTALHPFSFDRVVQAVELVRERLLRAAGALERDEIPYAIAGGNAVASWVARVDRDAARSTVDVDILVRREDLEAIKQALERVGFVYRRAGGLDMFLDGPDGRPRSGIHLIFAGEKVREHEPTANPSVAQHEVAEGAYRVLALDALVQIKLTAFRDKDRTHLRDFIELGLVDASWLSRLPEALAVRLKQLLDNPE